MTSYDCRTALREGVARTITAFQGLLDEGRLDTRDLPERKD